MIQTHRNGNFLQVHSDQRATDIQTGISLDFLQGNRMTEAVIGGGGKGAARLGLGLHVHDLRTRHGFVFHNQRTVQMLAALRGDINALRGEYAAQSIENGLSDLRRGPTAHALAHHLAGAAAHHNDLPRVKVRLIHQLLSCLGRLVLHLPKQVFLFQFMHDTAHENSFLSLEEKNSAFDVDRQRSR